MCHNLVKYQSFVNRTDVTNATNQLLHLPRFFAQFKPRHMLTMEKIINYLKTKPNCMAEYQDVKALFEEEYQTYVKRIFKSPFFHKFVITDTVGSVLIFTFLGLKNTERKIIHTESTLPCNLPECQS